MSSEIAHQYYYKYYENYKVALHTSKTDDDLFNQLKDVNTYWSNFDIVIYSPSIESGVDFNLKYFDNMYCILAPASTSQRGFMQMANRIRNLNDNNIQVFLNGMTYNDKVFEYTYSEVKNYFNTISNKYANKKIVYNKDNKATIQTTDNLYNNILIFNLLESFNKNSTYFVKGLIQILNKKSYTYEFLNKQKNDEIIKEKLKKLNSEINNNIIIQDNVVQKKKRGRKKIINEQINESVTETVKEPVKEQVTNLNSSVIKQNIVFAIDVCNNTFNELLKKQKNSKLTSNEKFQIEKFNYKKIFGVDNIDAKFIDIYYRKQHIVIGLKYLFSGDIVDQMYFNDEDKILYSNVVKVERKQILLSLLNKLKFSLENISVSVDTTKQRSCWEK